MYCLRTPSARGQSPSRLQSRGPDAHCGVEAAELATQMTLPVGEVHWQHHPSGQLRALAFHRALGESAEGLSGCPCCGGLPSWH